MSRRDSSHDDVTVIASPLRRTKQSPSNYELTIAADFVAYTQDKPFLPDVCRPVPNQHVRITPHYSAI